MFTTDHAALDERSFDGLDFAAVVEAPDSKAWSADKLTRAFTAVQSGSKLIMLALRELIYNSSLEGKKILGAYHRCFY